MPTNPNFSYSSAATPAFLYAGAVLQSMQQDQPEGYMYRQRADTAAVAGTRGVYDATQAGGVGFDGVNELGVTINGADFVPPAASANLAAWIVAMNAIPLLATVGAVVSTTGGTNVRVTGPVDGSALTLAAVQPDSPDLTLGAFAATVAPVPAVAAVTAPVIRPGMGVVFRDFQWNLEAPLTDSPLVRYAGMVTRESLLSDATVIGLTGALVFPRKLIDENRCQVKRKGRMTLLAATGAVITEGAPVFLGRLNSEAGFYYAADDGGNTRLEITGATWIQAGTGDAEAEKGLLALFL